MSSERWHELYEVFEQALAKLPDERAAFIEEVCGDDARLRQAVSTLLAADIKADSFMETSPLAPLREDGEARGVEVAAPKHLGPYRLLRRIGRGGMGSVYLAQRDDDEFELQVAIKIIPWELGSAEVVRRLRSERQILAGLDHPHIARLYDGGTTPEGLPYFVMEYIEGVPIDVFCDEQRLSIDERIDLFVKVCAAAHYAHQNLVVHRDIKPSNILVTADRGPKLLDFGIAKLLKPQVAASDAEPTAAWMRMMTPNYASPEQVRGRPVTTASDVYSLGVLLHKLLVGALPFSFDGMSPGEIERTLLDRQPQRLSDRVDPRQLSGEKGEALAKMSRARGVRPEQLWRQLRGDLDNIVLKALRGAPQQRYASVEQLAEDLRRHVEGYPVLARRGSLTYRGGKLVRRHAWAVMAALLSCGLVVAFVVALAAQKAQTERERDEARQERDQKIEVIALVKDIFQTADPAEARGENMTVREALDRSGGLFDRRLAEQPAVRATLSDTVGTIYLNLGLLEQAKGHLEAALDLRRELYGLDSAETIESLIVLSIWLRERDEYPRARTLASEALDKTRRLRGEGHPELVRPLNNLVTLLCYEAEIDLAEPLAEETLELARSRLEETDPEIAVATNNYAYVASKQGDFSAAVEGYKDGLRILRYQKGEDHPEVAEVLNNLAVSQHRLRDLVAAEETYREALALRRKLFGDAHYSVAASLVNLAALLREKGETEAAVGAYMEGFEISKATLGMDHSRTLWAGNSLASALLETGEAEAAEEVIREGLPIWEASSTLDGSLIARTNGVLGAALAEQGVNEEAEARLVASFEALQRQRGEEDRWALEVAGHLLSFYEKRGRSAEASPYRKLLADR